MDLFTKQLRGLSLREKWRILRVARSGSRIEDPDNAALIESSLREEFTPRQTRSWWWQVIAFAVIWAALVWVRVVTEATWLAGGIGGGMVVLITALWARNREKATARANGWLTNERDT
jgi:hypothetical protein